MGFARRHLPSFVLLWLVFQAATLSALVPMGCCPAHESERRADTECHGTVQDICPMTSATGKECPMHAGRTAAPPKDVADCIMIAPCHGPATALALLLPVAGVLTDEPSHLPDGGVARLAPPAGQPALSLTFTLDPPPPRPAA